MSKAFHYEKHILYYVGLRFDPAADYTENKRLLIADLIRVRGQNGAVIVVDEVIKLVKRRIRDPKLRPVSFNQQQQEAFLVWLKDLRQHLGPKVTKPKPKPTKKQSAEAKQCRNKRRAKARARRKASYLATETQAHNGKAGQSKWSTDRRYRRCA